MDNPIFIGKVLHHFEQLSSTNDHATDLLAKSKPAEGTVISTFNQIQGRGQIGSKWESAPGRNISLSIILYPNFLKPNDQFLLNKAIALGVRAFVSELTNHKVYVKWPNDLIVNNKKLGGILIQNNLSTKQITASVIGIGINVNQKIFEEAPNPISLSMLNDKYFDLEKLRYKLFGSVEQFYLRLKSSAYSKLDKAYLSNLYKFEEEALYQDKFGNRFIGKIKDIDENGRLVVQVKSELAFFNVKEIQFIQ